MKKMKIILPILIVVIILSSYKFYLNYKSNQQELREKGIERCYVMNVLGYPQLSYHSKKNSYDSKYYNEMLQKKDFVARVEYLNDYVEKSFPEIDFDKLTIEEIKCTPGKTSKKLWDLAEDLNEKNTSIEDVFYIAYEQMSSDRQYIMEIMDYGELLKEGIEYDREKLYYEENFLEDTELPAKLEKLNQNIKTELSGEYEEITVERLLNDQLQVVEELREIEQKCPDILG